MDLRFDHAVIAVRDLGLARQVFEQKLGLQVYLGGRHTGLGTENAIVRFGLDYLELLGIADPAEVAAAGLKRAALLEFLEQRAGGMLGFCLATTDLDGLAERFRATGLDAMGPYDMQRLRPDGVLLRWRLLVPGGTAWRRPWPFFIQWEMADEARLDLEQPGQHPLGADGVAGVSVVVRDLEAAHYLYGTQLGLEIADEGETSAGKRLTYRAANSSIDLILPSAESPAHRFMDDHGEGLYQVFIHVRSSELVRRRLGEHGIHLTGDGSPAAPWAIPAEEALGAHLVLVGG